MKSTHVATNLDHLNESAATEANEQEPNKADNRWSAVTASVQVGDGGQGRDRTADLPLFRRTLVPTELPGRKAVIASPCWRP